MNLDAGLATSVAERDPGPVVELPRSSLPGAVIATVGLIAAIILFLVLDARRQRISADRQPVELGTATAFSSPSPLVVPTENPVPPYVTYQPPVPVTVTYRSLGPAPQTVRSFVPSTPRTIVEPAYANVAPPVETTLVERAFVPAETFAPPSFDDPAVVIGTAISRSASPASAATVTSKSEAPQRDGQAEGATKRPTYVARPANPGRLLSAGTLIAAVLETPIDTSRPGLVRAVVSKDATGFEGSAVLVPRGSRLIGEYQSDIGPGQNRVLVSWSRMILPDGASIRLSAPATDSLGGAGVPGRVSGFFLQRFLSATFQTALSIGQSLAARRTNTVVVGIPVGSVTNVTAPTISPGGSRRKIMVKQGTLVNVFVAEDIDLSSAPTAD